MNKSELTKVQREIVEAGMGSMFVTAGAGSGKTRVLTHRIAHLVEELGIPDHGVLALTFTNKAGAEMRERAERMLGRPIGVFLGTFHSFCARVLRKSIHHLGGAYDGNFTIYDVPSQRKVLKEVTEANGFSALVKDPYKIVEWHIGRMKNNDMTLAEYEKSIRKRDEHSDKIGESIEAYQERLAANNALDFDDLLIKTLELFEKCPDVLARLQERFQYVLVDEFQDTNAVQYKIAYMLAKAHGNIMVVGDDDQCIYTWRGATVENFKALKRDFPDLRTYKLEQNFRSSRNIVELAAKLVEQNTERVAKTVFSEVGDGVVANRCYFDEREEARSIAVAILEQVRGGGRYSDHAVLLRTNALSRIFEEQFRFHDIPYVVWGGYKFYDRAEVRQALDYLRLVVNPRDDVTVANCLSFPRRGIGEKTMELLGAGMWDTLLSVTRGDRALDTGKKALQGIADFVGVVETLQKTYADEGIVGLADCFLRVTGLEQAYKDSKSKDDEGRVDNLMELVNDLKTFAERNPGEGLASFLQSVSLASDVDDKNPDGCVVISTVHSVKGLEFDHVYIAALERDIFPLARAMHSLAELEEERRLLYVGMTRAKRHLELSCCSSRYYHGNRSFQSPSPFIEECGLENKPQGLGNRAQVLLDKDLGTAKKSGIIANEEAHTEEFDEGMRVKHASFGAGTIVEIINDTILKIDFDNVGTKMLTVAFANLMKV